MPEELHRQATEAKAQSIIAEELQRPWLVRTGFAGSPEEGPGKGLPVARLRRETTLPLKAIAAGLGLGTSKSANGKLHQFMKATPEPPTPINCRSDYR